MRHEIVVASPIGFCLGVKRAIKLATRARRQYQMVWTLGPLIHNPVVVRELRKQGIRKLRSLSEFSEGALVIRSHGSPPELHDRAHQLGIPVIDATCPHVARVQRIVTDLIDAGFLVIIVGERSHPEVRSLLAFAKGRGIVYQTDQQHRPILSSEENYEPFRACPGAVEACKRRVGVVAQTTIPVSALQSALTCISRHDFGELRVYNTICHEVASRQAAVERVARQVDVMLVVGGHNSANTTRLADIARACRRPTYQVESTRELEELELETWSKIGLAAGTSTPSRVVDDILRVLRKRLTPRELCAGTAEGDN